MNYYDFVSDVIDQKIALKSEYVKGDFTPNELILYSYNKMSFPDFLIAYTDSVDVNEYRIRNALSFEETIAVIYCLFQQNYYTCFDDMSGFYYYSKLDSIRKKPDENFNIELQ